jgi:sterol desaturase/sphingolipid hydroxylase (fatty acid hydroxylase superfamily)
MRKITRTLWFPGILLGALGVVAGGLQGGLDPVFCVVVAGIAAIVLILVGQWLMPYRDDWKAPPPTFGLDLVHLVFTALTNDLTRLATTGLFVWGSTWLSGAFGAQLWPSEWPLALQLVIAVVIGDFGVYWWHRLCHEVPLLWRFHAVHHSADRLYVFAAGRNHPFQVAVDHVAQVLPLILLGVSGDVLALLAVMTLVLGLLQHANIDMDHGLWNRIFATADYHRWHHSPEIAESKTNYGDNLILWDVVFGTRWLPEGRRPLSVGLPGWVVPENVFAHLKAPFRDQ